MSIPALPADRRFVTSDAEGNLTPFVLSKIEEHLPPGAEGVSDHGALTGLTDDDHLQYALSDGTRGDFAPAAHSHAVADVTGLQSALDAKAGINHAGLKGRYVGINAQAGTTYTPVLADEGKLVTIYNTNAITVTLPSDASLAMPVGGSIDFTVIGAGMATFVAGSGATVNGTPSLVTRAQWSTVTAIKRGTNRWLIVGDLA